ncbi:hypothetical protein X777_05639 [Ooceraea biroi]|uniref:Uncharacterized protein n=1 Tax=Ooceraea biroi TaxID=2015173 RepID=A0A026WH58_OOCBI|nr:hypothetical protein X777_05639 [Ooceraea biroi]
MKPQTFSSVKSTHNKIQKQVCTSAISTAVVPMTQISASMRFRNTSWAISLSVSQAPNSLVNITREYRAFTNRQESALLGSDNFGSKLSCTIHGSTPFLFCSILLTSKVKQPMKNVICSRNVTNTPTAA